MNATNYYARKPRFTCLGSVRGCCGQIHLEKEDAANCVQVDREACWSLGGGAYSDREIVSSHTYTYSDRCAIGSDLMPRLRGDVP